MLSRALRTDLFGVSVRSLLKQNFSNGFLILLKLGIFHSKFYVFILSYSEVVFMVRLVSLDNTNLGILFQVQLLEDCIQAVEFSFRQILLDDKNKNKEMRKIKDKKKKELKKIGEDWKRKISQQSEVLILGPLGYGPSTLPLRHSARSINTGNIKFNIGTYDVMQASPNYH